MVGNRCVGSVISGLSPPQAIKKVRRPWGAQQQKSEAYEKGERDESAGRAGTKDSTDAAQRVPTFPCGSSVMTLPPYFKYGPTTAFQIT
jgi:hypothetical protein